MNQRIRRGSRGSVSIEALVLVPLFLAVVFTIMEASLWIHASTVAQAAAQDGVRAGTVVGGSETQARATAQEILGQRSVGEDWQVTTTVDGRNLTVSVAGFATSVVPGVSLGVHESATMPLEAG